MGRVNTRHNLALALARHRSRLIEKKIVIEAETLEEAQQAVRAGADVIQFDKVEPALLAQWCPDLRRQWLCAWPAGCRRHTS
nr:hypothetical protein [Pusillimonas sp. ANT_WB101]